MFIGIIVFLFLAYVIVVRDIINEYLWSDTNIKDNIEALIFVFYNKW